MSRCILLLAVAGLTAAGPAAADDKPGAPTKLDGTYTIVSGERNGKAIPEEEIKGSVVTFKGDRVIGTGKDRKEFFAATYRLDTSAEPWKIAMTSTAPTKGEKTAGVIKAEGDELRICYALPGGQTPAEFKTTDKQQCFVLKRQAK
jgi:uncharacterized protein (TIGR03067 family)